MVWQLTSLVHGGVRQPLARQFHINVEHLERALEQRTVPGRMFRRFLRRRRSVTLMLVECRPLLRVERVGYQARVASDCLREDVARIVDDLRRAFRGCENTSIRLVERERESITYVELQCVRTDGEEPVAARPLFRCWPDFACKWENAQAQQRLCALSTQFCVYIRCDTEYVRTFRCNNARSRFDNISVSECQRQRECDGENHRQQCGTAHCV